MQRILINVCSGVFQFSDTAITWFKKHGIDNPYELKRDHPLLIQCFKELGTNAQYWWSEFKIIEIPDGVEWEIREYDGKESVHEKHRIWE
jgi:hypothetical protein